MGKREIGELSLQDLVVSLLIAEMVAIGIDKINESIFITIVPVFLLAFLEIFSAYLSLKSNKIRDIFIGKPSVIIKNGSINYKEMIRQRYTLDDLLLECRIKGFSNLEEVGWAILENNGKLSIFKKEDNVFPLPIVLDGFIIESSLVLMDKDKEWLIKLLSTNHIDYKDILYCYFNNNSFYINFR